MHDCVMETCAQCPKCGALSLMCTIDYAKSLNMVITERLIADYGFPRDDKFNLNKALQSVRGVIKAILGEYGYRTQVNWDHDKYIAAVAALDQVLPEGAGVMQTAIWRYRQESEERERAYKQQMDRRRQEYIAKHGKIQLPVLKEDD